MKISKINEYSYSYAEYMVSDGKQELRCVCNSVPLPCGQEPKIGMAVKMLYAFNYGKLLLKKENSLNSYLILKTEKYGFQYKLIGSVIDKKNALIKVFDFIISLEYFYPNRISEFENGDVISFITDRIECELDI